MGTTIITKNGSGAPAASDLVAGELAVDLTNKRLYTEDSGANILELGSNPSTIVVAGTSTLTGNVTASSDVSVGGNLTVTGNATIEGNLTFGNAATDTITLTADVASSIVPSADDTYDLGATASRWRDIYIDGTAYLDAINFNGTAITATAAELNILDGVTSTAAELNILDGVTATAAELNILDGVTSTAAELNILDGVTATAAELNILDGVTSTAAELNILDGVTSTAAELNLLDGSTANTVVNSKAVVYGSSGELAGTLSTAAQTNVTSLGTLSSLTVSGDLTVDTSTLKVDSSNNRVGIGTTSPETNLHIEDSSSFSIVRLVAATTENAGIDFGDPDDRDIGRVRYNNSDNSMVFHTNAAEQMRIDSAGNVGIGTTSPRSVSGYNSLALDGSTSGLLDVNTNGTRVLSVYGASNDINFVNPTSSGAMRLYTNDTERMRIDSSGNVGIGTTSVTSGFKMEVLGDLRVGDAVGDDAVELGWSSGASQGFVQAYDRGASAFRNLNLNNAVTIDSSGNVGIDTSSP